MCMYKEPIIIIVLFRCDSENCRALLQRYDAPPAIDAATEETTQLHVSI